MELGSKPNLAIKVGSFSFVSSSFVAGDVDERSPDAQTENSGMLGFTF